MRATKTKPANRNNFTTGRLNITERDGAYEVNVRNEYCGRFRNERTAVLVRNRTRRLFSMKPARS